MEVKAPLFQSFPFNSYMSSNEPILLPSLMPLKTGKGWGCRTVQCLPSMCEAPAAQNQTSNHHQQTPMSLRQGQHDPIADCIHLSIAG